MARIDMLRLKLKELERKIESLVPSEPTTPVLQCMHIQEQQPNGVSAGDSVADTWQTRNLNTVVTNTITGALLTNNQITLPPGKYYVSAHAVAFSVFSHVIRIVSTTGTLIDGVGGFANNTANLSALVGQITLTAPSTIMLEHYTATQRERGLGSPIETGDIEVYASVFIQKVE